jgi:hypothetical protein
LERIGEAGASYPPLPGLLTDDPELPDDELPLPDDEPLLLLFDEGE